MSSDPAALPDRVRTRVIGLAADALGALPADQIPGPLRRVAAFTPARRARVAGGPLLAALSDDTFRDHLAIQVRARNVELVAALAEGEQTAESAALAFLLRDDGWDEVVGAVVALEQEAAATEDDSVISAALEAAQERLGRRDAELVRLRKALAATEEELKAEKASVRHRIGDVRARSRDAGAEAEAGRAAAEEQLALRDAALVAVRNELAQVQSRIAELEAELGRTRRESRAEREVGTVRARLLLDTLLQAGQGLRQELALPVVDGAPADRVVADLAEDGVRAPSGSGSRPLDDPARLRELLALPGFHLVVDGYNVTRDSWGDLTLEEQRARLLRGVAPVVARTGIELTVVFDGANAESRPPLSPPRGVRVVFSPWGVIADDVIRDFVAAEPPGRPLGVVTSDQEIVRAVTRRPGVYAIASRALVRLLA